MRAAVLLAVGLMISGGPVGSALAGVEYHFMPGVEGQALGPAQFVHVAPVVGPKDFTVLLTGSLIGRAPSSDEQSARAYLDKWGLGVLNPRAGRDVGIVGQVQLDGRQEGEFLRLEFPEPAQLTFLTFASVGLADRFDLVADGTPIDLGTFFPGLSTIREISLAQGNWPGTVDFTRASRSLPFATIWDIFVTDSIGDGIQLENVGANPIPEPSTLMLWTVALAALGIFGVRRRAGR
ncbi:MAG: PEP-CTERM sorting domain-containing protein [Pirellulaceae bacterium]